jgi:hypothetical protein
LITLNVGEPGLELGETGLEELRPFAVPVRIRVLSHQEEEKLRIAWGRGAVDRLQVLKLGPM